MTNYETELRERWRKIMPAMKREVRRVAAGAGGSGYARPLKVGPLPSKGVPKINDTVAYVWREGRRS